MFLISVIICNTYYVINYNFTFNMGLDDSRKWGYDSFRMYVPILSKRMCVYLSKKAVAIETSCVYSVVYGSPKEESDSFRNVVAIQCGVWFS